MRGADRFSGEGMRARCWGKDLTVINLSVGGLFLASESPPPPTQRLVLELHLGAADLLQARVSVVWINDSSVPRAPHLPTGFGVRIHDMPLTDKLRLLGFLRQQIGLRAAGPGARIPTAH